MKRTTLLLTLIIVLVFLTTVAQGSIISFTYTGHGDGTMDGVPFPDSNFVITAIADTDERTAYDNGWFIDHLSASILIDGLGEFDFLSQTRTFVNQSWGMIGFSRGGLGGHDLFYGPRRVEFTTWEMLTPIGPLSGTGKLFQWNYSPQVVTAGGVLIFDDRTVIGSTFKAVPEPCTVLLFALGGLAVRWKRT